MVILYLVNKQKYQTSKIEKSMSQSFCNLRDAIEDCQNLNTDFSYCRPNCVNLKIVEYVLYMDNIWIFHFALLFWSNISNPPA